MTKMGAMLTASCCQEGFDMLLPAAVCAGFAFLYMQSLCALLSCMQPDSEPLAVSDFWTYKETVDAVLKWS